MFFKNLWYKIQNIGYTKQLSDYEKKRIVIFNTLNFTAFCLAIIRLSYTLLFTPSHFTYWAVASDVALTMVFVSMALLLHNHLYKIATITSFIVMPPLLAFSSIVSKDVGTEMYIILYMLVCFFFLHKPKKIIIAFTYCLLFFLVLRLKFQSPINISRAEPVALYFGVLNYICAFASILFTLYLIKFQVWKYEKSIRDKRELLRVSNIKIQVKSNQIEEQSILLLNKNIELTELNNVKIKLFSIISHDLRTSVYALKNILDTLAKGHFTKDEMLMT